MNIALRKTPRISVAQFVDMIRSYPDEEHWELLDGHPLLTSPQSCGTSASSRIFWARYDPLLSREVAGLSPDSGF